MFNGIWGMLGIGATGTVSSQDIVRDAQMMAGARTQLEMKQADLHHANLMQQANIMQNAAGQQASTLNSSFGPIYNAVANSQTGINPYTTGGSPINNQVKKPPLLSLCTADLKAEMMGVPISVLRDLWLAKHGDGWVSAKDMLDAVESDVEWSMAVVRLEACRAFEKIYLTDTDDYVYRLIQD